VTGETTPNSIYRRALSLPEHFLVFPDKKSSSTRPMISSQSRRAVLLIEHGRRREDHAISGAAEARADWLRNGAIRPCCCFRRCSSRHPARECATLHPGDGPGAPGLPRLAPTRHSAIRRGSDRLLPDVQSRSPGRCASTQDALARSLKESMVASLLIGMLRITPADMCGREVITLALLTRLTFGKRYATPSLTRCELR
jgi:hypothetical protein